MWSTIACNGNLGRLNLDYNSNPHSSIASRVGGSLLSLQCFLLSTVNPTFLLKMVFIFVGVRGVGGKCDGSSWKWKEETPKKMNLSLCACKISYWIFLKGWHL